MKQSVNTRSAQVTLPLFTQCFSRFKRCFHRCDNMLNCKKLSYTDQLERMQRIHGTFYILYKILLFKHFQSLHSLCIFQRFSSTSFNRWLVCFLIGVFTACTAVIVDIGIERLSEVKLDLVRKCKF